LPTAALLIAGMDNPKVGSVVKFSVENASAVIRMLTLVTGVGITLAVDDVNLYSGQVKHYQAVVTAVGANTVTVYEVACNRPLEARHVKYDNPIAKATIDVFAQIDPIANGSQAVVDQPDYPRCIQVVIVEAALSAGILTFTGTNQNGEAVVEVMDIGALGTGTHLTSNAFATILTSVISEVAGAAGGDTIEAGWADVFGLPSRPGGMLAAIHKYNEDDDDVDVPAYTEEYSTCAITTAANGVHDYEWFYTFI